MADETPNAELVVMDWDDVLAQSGSEARKATLEKMAGNVVLFAEFAFQERGRKNKRQVLTAVANCDGFEPTRVDIPERYAKRLSEVIRVKKSDPARLRLTAKVETGDRGPMLKPVHKDGKTPNGNENGTGANPLAANGQPTSTSRRRRQEPPEAGG